MVLRDLADPAIPANIGPAVSNIDNIGISLNKMKQYNGGRHTGVLF